MVHTHKIGSWILAVLVAFTCTFGAPTYVEAAQKTVHVKGYTKKDGTVVKPHDRKAPKEKDTRCTTCDRDANGKIHRSASAKKDFEKASGYPHGRPGYVVDHIVPLACGGPDLPSNMQWQTKTDAKAKDKTERVGCR
jgi:hypothetical protein